MGGNTSVRPDGPGRTWPGPCFACILSKRRLSCREMGRYGRRVKHMVDLSLSVHLAFSFWVPSQIYFSIHFAFL